MTDTLTAELLRSTLTHDELASIVIHLAEVEACGECVARPVRDTRGGGEVNVYKLDGDDLSVLLEVLDADCYTLRVAIDEGGVKFKLDNGTWSPALGSEEK